MYIIVHQATSVTVWEMSMLKSQSDRDGFLLRCGRGNYG